MELDRDLWNIGCSQCYSISAEALERRIGLDNPLNLYYAKFTTHRIALIHVLLIAWVALTHSLLVVIIALILGFVKVWVSILIWILAIGIHILLI